MNTRPTRFEWLLFLALGFMWGSSYLFIKIAVDDFGTFTLVALRLASALHCSGSSSAPPARSSPASRGSTAISS